MQEGVEGDAVKCFSKFISLCLWKDGKSSKTLLSKGRLEWNWMKEVKYLPSQCINAMQFFGNLKINEKDVNIENLT